jgi:hypothetical protein
MANLVSFAMMNHIHRRFGNPPRESRSRGFGISRAVFFNAVVPAKAGTQGKRRAVALDSRFRGNDDLGDGGGPYGRELPEPPGPRPIIGISSLVYPAGISNMLAAMVLRVTAVTVLWFSTVPSLSWCVTWIGKAS